MYKSSMIAVSSRNIQLLKPHRMASTLILSCNAAERSVGRVSVVRAKQQPAVAPHPRLVVKRYGANPNLPMSLRPYSASHLTSPDALATLRLPLPGHSRRITGENLEAP